MMAILPTGTTKEVVDERANRKFPLLLAEGKQNTSFKGFVKEVVPWFKGSHTLHDVGVQNSK